MDFTLSLTHFCETHGPKSVLCTQILPLDCAICLPPSPPLRARSSGETLDGNDQHIQHSAGRYHTVPSLRKTGTDLTLPTDFSGASTTINSEPESPNIERHPLFKHNDTDVSPQFRYGRAQGETCASCSFSAPETVADRLPSGAPGSVRADGKSKNGAPVFRSRELVCLGASPPNTNNMDVLGAVSNGSAANSYPGSSSYNSTHSHSDSCHDHTLTYLTAKSPSDPETYAALRASVIRTLSCELLPRGMSDGPLCFGDSFAGYTIAYVFRLTDPKARGRRRCYAFLALAGKDASRAFRACPMLWEAFASMAKGIEGAATRAVEEKERKEEQERREREELRASSKAASSFGRTANSSSSNKASEKMAYTPVSSFLTQRAMDPDGTMRRAGQTSPRSLADIVGDETIFAIMHQYFVALLRCLGDRFGGLPLANTESVYQTVADAEGLEPSKVPARVHNEPFTTTSQPSKSNNAGNPDRAEEATTPHPPTKESSDHQTRTRSADRTRSSRRAAPSNPNGSKPSEEDEPSPLPKKAPRKTQGQARGHGSSISSVEDEIDRAKRRLSKTLSLGSSGQCAPLQLTQAEVRGQVQVTPATAVTPGNVVVVVGGGGGERSVAA